MEKLMKIFAFVRLPKSELGKLPDGFGIRRNP